MITITFFAKEIEQNVKVNLESVTGFHIEGHAGFAKRGKDIVCAAVSALVMNTMNSIHSFTSDVFDYKEDEKKGMIDFRIVSEPCPETKLLFKYYYQTFNHQFSGPFIDTYFRCCAKC